MMIRVTPRGVISVLFHITRRLEVGASLELPISSFVIIFTDAPQSIWNLTSLFPISISVKISFAKRVFGKSEALTALTLEVVMLVIKSTSLSSESE